MPSVVISAGQELIDQAVEAICFNGGWVEGDKVEYAKFQILDWFGGQLKSHAEFQLKQMQAQGIQQVEQQLLAARASVTIDIQP